MGNTMQTKIKTAEWWKSTNPRQSEGAKLVGKGFIVGTIQAETQKALLIRTKAWFQILGIKPVEFWIPKIVIESREEMPQ